MEFLSLRRALIDPVTGREGAAIAVVSLPKFLSRAIVGSVSGDQSTSLLTVFISLFGADVGYLLTTFCPGEGPRHSTVMWLIIG